MAFTLNHGRYTDAGGATGAPLLKVQAQGTFNATLTDTTYPTTSPGVIISTGYVEMYDGSAMGSTDRDVLVQNDSSIGMYGGGQWTHGTDADRSKFWINAGTLGNWKTLTLKDNARLQFLDYTSTWYTTVKQYGSLLTITGNFTQDGYSVIEARGNFWISDQIAVTATATIGGNAKAEAVLKETPNPMYPAARWLQFISANSVSASSPPYDPPDLSTDGGWGAGWAPSSELSGTTAITLKFTH